ncbi:MAG: hypothetical protein R3F37_00780 [Candidatus Competibacteraceae bacterium]
MVTSAAVQPLALPLENGHQTAQLTAGSPTAIDSGRDALDWAVARLLAVHRFVKRVQPLACCRSAPAII